MILARILIMLAKEQREMKRIIGKLILLSMITIFVLSACGGPAAAPTAAPTEVVEEPTAVR